MKLIECNIFIFFLFLSIFSELGCQLNNTSTEKEPVHFYSISKHQLPIPILTYLETVHPNVKVIKVDKYNAADKKYQIELADGIRLVFDSETNFVKLDSTKNSK